jgi:hypothetical protein
MKALQAERARSGKHSAAPPDVHPSPPPAAATQRKKRPISELDTPTLSAHTCKRYKAEHETVRRRNKLLETMQAQVLDLESKLHIASKSELCLSEDNEGLKARISALSSGLGALDSRFSEAESDLAAARDELQWKTAKIERLERELAISANKLAASQLRRDGMKAELRMYKAREHRATVQAWKPAEQSVFKLRSGRLGKGPIALDVRMAILELVTIGVSTRFIYHAIVCCAQLFKIRLSGRITDASVRRVTLEAGVAGELQIAQTLNECSCTC